MGSDVAMIFSSSGAICSIRPIMMTPSLRWRSCPCGVSYDSYHFRLSVAVALLGPALLAPTYPRSGECPEVAFRVPRTVEREHVHPPLMGSVEKRMRPGLLEGVTARDVEDQRRCDPTGAEMQVAGDQRPVPGNVDVLDAVGRQGDHLLVAAANARIQVALLVVAL